MATTKERTKWDVGRFFRTLAYYRVIPFVGNFDRQTKPKINQPQKQGVVLVAGATGGVGKRVVRQLQQQGYSTRSLVRDAQRAQEILGKDSKKTDLVEADLTLPETLTPRLFANISAIICCSGTRVQPVEGDTPNREKYYQGIKFYMPEVVDTPEVVEYRGIQHLLQAAVKNAKETTIFDFSQPSPDLKETWGVLDDVVMGGVSESNIYLTDEAAVFAGNISTANSGGFASVRTRNFANSLDLSNFEGIQLRVKGDGKRYKFILRTDPKWDSVSYCYSFDTVYNIWQTVRIPFSEFIPVFRAKTRYDKESLDPSKICSIQLMLSKFEYDRQLNPKFSTGGFQMQIASIQAYGGQQLPHFVHISSAGVTRPGRPGLNLDEEPPAVRMNDQLGGILTWKLRGEEAIRNSGLPYTIIRPCALTEEPGGKSLVFDQGDNMRGQVSREDVAELCLQALNREEAFNKTFEVKAGDENRPADFDWQGCFANLQAD